MKRFLKIFVYCLLALLVFIAGLASYVYIKRNELKKVMIELMNESLNAPVTIGDIHFDFIHSFPQLGLDLQEVSVADGLKRSTPLLKAEHVYVGFNLWDIINKNYRIRKISAKQGVINIYIDKDGKDNFHIVKTSSETDNRFMLDLKQAELDRFTITYTDKQSSQLYEGMLERANLSLSYTSHLLEINIKGLFFVEQAKTGNLVVLKSKRLEITGGLSYDFNTKALHFLPTDIQINKLRCTLSGNVIAKQKYSDLNIVFHSQKIDIASLLSVLPMGNTLSEDWKSDGKAYFNGSIKGKLSKTAFPKIIVSFGIENGELENPKKETYLTNISCTGQLHNQSGNFILLLKPLSFKMAGSDFKGELNVTNFKRPFLTGKAICDFTGNDLIKLTHADWCEKANGNIHAEVIFAGALDDFSDKTRVAKTTISGNIHFQLDHISFKDQRKEIESLQGELSVHPSSITINKLNATIDKSDVQVTGKLENAIGYLFLKQPMTVNLNYHSNFFDLNDFMMPLVSNDLKSETSLLLPERLKLKATVSIDRFVYNKLESANTKATIYWDEKVIDLKDVTAQMISGKVSLSGQVSLSSDNRYRLTSNGQIENVSITELFRQCNNFGQQNLTDKNLKGNLSTTFDIASVWSSQWICDLSKLLVSTNTTITHGEIINYSPLLKLSRFASVDDLRNLKFASLHNTIDILEQVITIPEMEIKSNAINLTLAGTHTFNNYIDYRLKLKLSELLKNKRKPVENEFGEEDNADNGLWLYLTMKGPVDDPKITYDKTAVKTKIKQDLKKEKENIKAILKRELGIGKDTTIREKKSNTEELEFEKD